MKHEILEKEFNEGFDLDVVKKLPVKADIQLVINFNFKDLSYEKETEDKK